MGVPQAVRPVCIYPPSSHSTTPYTTLAAVPNTITGPAIRNILAAMPVIRPSACVKYTLKDFFIFLSKFGRNSFFYITKQAPEYILLLYLLDTCFLVQSQFAHFQILVLYLSVGL